MGKKFEKIETAMEYLDIQKQFILYTTYFRKETGKCLLLGMHLAYNSMFVTENAQTCNYFRSVLRKFGNDQLHKIQPNDFFSIEQRSVDGETYKSLYCKFIEYDKVYIDVVQAHAMTQAIDSILNRYEFGRLVFTGRIFFLSKYNEKYSKHFSEPEEDELHSSWFQIPIPMFWFMRKILDTENI